MRLLLIIPALNEAENLRKLLPYLRGEIGDRGRIVVSDGGSVDDSKSVCLANDVTFFSSPERGRGPQMNAAAEAFGPAEIYYFVHADTFPPRNFTKDIEIGIRRGYSVGCYRFRFDSDHPLLRINSFCTRFSALHFRGGDQSLYVSREVWEELGGFRPDMLIMEEYDFIERARERSPFLIIPREVTVSARKYQNNSYLRVQLANLRVFRMYRRGASQDAMVSTYRQMLN